MSSIYENLPILTGSQKQILWAETIRKEKLQSIADTLDELDPNTLPSDLTPKWEMMIEILLHQKTASFWIENRNETVGNIFALLAKIHKIPDIA